MQQQPASDPSQPMAWEAAVEQAQAPAPAQPGAAQAAPQQQQPAAPQPAAQAHPGATSQAGLPAAPYQPTAAQQPASSPTSRAGAIDDPNSPLAPLLKAIQMALSKGSSDIHIHAGLPPAARINGSVVPLPGMDAITEDVLVEAIREITRRSPIKLKEYVDTGESDFSWELPGVARFRINFFRERGNTSIVMRAIPAEVRTLEEIGVPAVLSQVADTPRGLVLVTGATGSGKTTTLAAIIDHINTHQEKHILTIEDPIEILHTNKRSILSQREVGSDTPDFGQALRRALRQDPDVILIGEIRDEETMHVALRAAETGHLVLATLHTLDAAETIGRVLDLFPPQHERQARAMLASSLVGIVSQRLVRTVDDSRVPAVEILLNTSRAQRCISDPNETIRLHDVISEGSYYGMQSFDQALLRHLIDGRIDVEEALRNCTTPQNFRLMMEAEGLGPDGRPTAEALAARELRVSQQMDAVEEPAEALPQVAPPPPGGEQGGPPGPQTAAPLSFEEAATDAPLPSTAPPPPTVPPPGAAA